MRKVLYIFGLLTDDDIAWIADTGIRRHVKAGEVLIREGVFVDSIIIILEGECVVTAETVGKIARLGVGEIIGEMSFVDSAPPSATVTVERDGLVLLIDKTAMLKKLEGDIAFGRRFYQALAVFLADRLRATVRRLGYGTQDRLDRPLETPDELDAQLLDRVSDAGERFARLLNVVR
ncbi:MAG TPA: cyclic nucleotide-binding domain-containing protein [Methylovirgula sp.]|jgi:CRP/FNR family cyclic AMP-dependent transcriptional regulator|nr:cyclic nucleotide-binding domain-containing protein [Methylovirgula sp.]